MANLKLLSNAVVFYLLVVMAGLAGPASAEGAESFWVSVPNESSVEEIRLAVGQERVVRLKATLCGKRLLKAYSLSAVYDAAVLAVGEVAAAPGAPIPVMQSNRSLAGHLRVNGLDVTGISGPVEVALIDVSLKGLGAGKTTLQLAFDNFGQSRNDQFIPPPLLLDVVIY